MKWIKKLLGADSQSASEESASTYSDNDISVITDTARRLADILNESLHLSNDSKNPETKISRLNVAKAKLIELEELKEKYPFIQLISLHGVKLTIAELELEYKTACYQEIANGNIEGKALEKAGLIEEAIEVYEKLVSSKVETPFTYKRLAIIYRKKKNLEKEVSAIEAGLRNVPKSNAAHYEWLLDRLKKISLS